MKTYSRYFRVVIALLLLGSVYGLFVPSLISMKDTVAVISGLALAFLTPPCIYAIFKGLSEEKDTK
ncbi:hypothetical protein RQD06_001428 [Klebsiella pneumoniae]|nr:hypothetical protein [Klebsiella pneumoniae]ELH2097911.1 hypothetical protein [Klebsiella pneumoniae]DAO12525.1 MAG TPA: hypothetical protein [Caudoviricetes sp.]HDH0344384.1 hypothetical protein [Klebsiella pneumoniae]